MLCGSCIEGKLTWSVEKDELVESRDSAKQVKIAKEYAEATISKEKQMNGSEKI